jgi:hypothetical protein
MENKKKKEALESQMKAAGKKPELEKFYQQVVKGFGYEYQRRA